MITAVLCGNEMRDYYEDRKSNVGTLAGRMSYENGMKLYLIENFIGYPILMAITYSAVLLMNLFIKHFGTSKTMKED